MDSADPALRRKKHKRAPERRHWDHLMSTLHTERDFQKKGVRHDGTFFRFAGFAMEHIRQSKSQHIQDLWVLFELDGKRDGFFVEFGAASGRKFSNTFMLEQNFGWTGVLGEPNPEYHDMLARLRSAPVCTDLIHRASGQEMRFAAMERGMFSGLADETTEVGKDGVREIVTLQTISLNDMLDRYAAPARIDYMSIDVEGAELEILRGFDFDSHRVTCFTVEADDAEDREAILDLMAQNGYVQRWPEFGLGELFLIDARWPE